MNPTFLAINHIHQETVWLDPVEEGFELLISESDSKKVYRFIGVAEEKFKSLEKIKSPVNPLQVILPGHDHSGGRASAWAHQLKVNPSLTQSQTDFVREASANLGPPPRLLKVVPTS